MENTNKEKFYYRNDWQFGKDDRYTLTIEINSAEIYLVPTILIYRSGDSWGPLKYVDIIFMWLGFKFSIGDTR